MALISLSPADQSLFSDSLGLFPNSALMNYPTAETPIPAAINSQNLDLTDSFGSLDFNLLGAQNGFFPQNRDLLSNSWLSLGASTLSSSQPGTNPTEKRAAVITDGATSTDGSEKRMTLRILQQYIPEDGDIKKINWREVPLDKLELLSNLDLSDPLATNAKFEFGKRKLDEVSPFRQKQGLSQIETAYNDSFDPQIARFLGQLYHDGKGEVVKKDLDKSISFFEKASEQSVEGKLDLANTLIERNQSGDKERAVKIYQELSNSEDPVINSPAKAALKTLQ